MGSVTRAAQQLLISRGAKITADGAWGRKTQLAYDSAEPGIQAAIRTMFTAEGKIPPFELRWISVQEAETLVDRAAQEVGLSAYSAELRRFLRYEAPRNHAGTHYNVNASNGGSRGLMQMQRAAWADSKRRYPALAGYDKVFDPYQNILAGVVYASINIQGLRRRKFPVTGKNLYLAHNQGIGFFDGTRTAVDKQSKEVQKLIAEGPDR